MRAEDLDEQFPTVQLDSDALDAARMVAEHHLPGLVVADAGGKPYAVLLASELLRFVLPRYVQDDLALAGVLSDEIDDHADQNLTGKTVGDLLPKRPRSTTSVDARASAFKVAAEIVRSQSPLIAVTKDGKLHGVITASRLLASALKS